MDEKKEHEKEGSSPPPEQDDDDGDDEERRTSLLYASMMSPFSSSLCLSSLQLENGHGGATTQHYTHHTNTAATSSATIIKTNIKNRRMLLNRSTSSSSSLSVTGADYDGAAAVVQRAITNVEAVLDRELFINTYSVSNISSNSSTASVGGGDQQSQEEDSICSDLRQLDTWEDNVREDLVRAEDEWRLRGGKRRSLNSIAHTGCSSNNQRNRRVVIVSGHGGGHGISSEENENLVHLPRHHSHVVDVDDAKREDTETELSTDDDDDDEHGEKQEQDRDFIKTKRPPPASIVTHQADTAMSSCSSMASLADFATENGNVDSLLTAAAVNVSTAASSPNNSIRTLGGNTEGTTTTNVPPARRAAASMGSSGVSVTMAYDVLSSQVRTDNRSILCNWLQEKMHWRNVLIAGGDGAGCDGDGTGNHIVHTIATHSSPKRFERAMYDLPLRPLAPRSTATSRDFTAQKTISSTTNDKAVTTAQQPNSRRKCYRRNSWKLGVPVLGSATVSNDGELRMLLLCGGGLDTSSGTDCISLALQVFHENDGE
jgi:hypothetical protein